jgi:hypothetical protein
MSLIVKSWNNDAVDSETVFIHLLDENTGEKLTLRTKFNQGDKAHPWRVSSGFMFFIKLPGSFR